MINLRLVLTAIILFVSHSLSQGQDNVCSTSAPLLVFTGNTACVTGTTVGATADYGGNSYCTASPNGGQVANRDVWYRFTTPATLSGCWTFNLQRGTAQGDLMLRIFKTCSSPVGSSSVCSSNDYVDLSSTQFTAADWTPNTTYLIQITARSTAANAGTFDLCVTRSAAVASNDACATPMMITSVQQQTGNHTFGCNYTWIPAQDANIPASQVCASTLENVAWYSFVAQANGTITLSFQDIQCNGAGAGFQLGVWTGNSCGSWTYLGCSAASGGNVNLNITNAIAGQKFYMALDGNAGSNCHFKISASNVLPLPIKLLTFNAKQKGNSVVLDWSTATETNNDYFTVESSLDGLNYETVGTRKGAGNSNNIKFYELNDPSLFKGTKYYRLKQTDFDGSFTYSSVVAVKAQQRIEQVLVSPNPANDAASFTFDAYSKGIAQIRLVNTKGQEMMKKEFVMTSGKNEVVLFLEELNSGIYFISLVSEDISIKTQFIKQ